MNESYPSRRVPQQNPMKHRPSHRVATIDPMIHGRVNEVSMGSGSQAPSLSRHQLTNRNHRCETIQYCDDEFRILKQVVNFQIDGDSQIIPSTILADLTI